MGGVADQYDAGKGITIQIFICFVATSIPDPVTLAVLCRAARLRRSRDFWQFHLHVDRTVSPQQGTLSPKPYPDPPM